MTTEAKSVLVVGVSHRRAGLDLRERLHLDASEATGLARELARDGGEAVTLSTCNRTEIYLADGASAAAAGRARAALARVSGLPEHELERALAALEGEEAALHLFRVAAGLDSLVMGEGQILGQVRDAFGAALAAGSTGPILNRLFTQALRVGKRVRSEIRVPRVSASVPAAAAELARRVVGDLEGRRVLVIGAGKMGELAADNLVSRGVEKVFVANHRMEGAERLAARFGGEAIPFERIAEELVRADVVVSSTRCPRTILGPEEVASAARRRRGRPLLILDIAVPRDVDPAVGRLEGCLLYDVDDLGSPLAEVSEGEAQELAKAEELLGEEMAAFEEWRLALDVVPAIAAVRRRAEEIRASELARSASRFRGLSAAEREALDGVTARIVNKLLHTPTVRVKDAAGTPEGRAYADALRRLFAPNEDAPVSAEPPGRAEERRSP